MLSFYFALHLLPTQQLPSIQQQQQQPLQQDAISLVKDRRKNSLSSNPGYTLTWFLGELDFEKSVIHKFAKHGYLKLLQESIEKAKDPKDRRTLLDLQNNVNNQTPLQIAIQHGQTTAAIYLIQAGAGLDLKDKIDRTALHYASR